MKKNKKELTWTELEKRSERFLRPMQTEAECLKNPFGNIGGYSPYYHYSLGGHYQAQNIGNDEQAWFSHWISYPKIWCAVKWGHRRDSATRNTTKRFVVDARTSMIVWQNYDKTQDNYKEDYYG